MTKRFATLLALLLMVSMLLGSVSFAEGADNEPANYGGLAPMADAGDPITFHIFVRDPELDPAADNPVISKIQELTGVTIDFEFLVGDLETKIGTMIAGGDYPDAVFAGDDVAKMIDAGAFIPLEDLIPQYPNLNKLYSKKIKSMYANDGHIYALELYNMGVTDVTEPAPVFQNTTGFFIQKAVLEDAGYPIPRTVEEYFKLIEDYMAKYPEIDGVKTRGFEMLLDGWRNWSVLNPPMHLMGSGNEGALFVDQETLESSFYQISDVAKEYNRQINQAYRKGLIAPESYTNSYDQYMANLATGAVLGFFDQTWNFQNAEMSLKDEGKYNRTWISVPLTVPGVEDGYIDKPNGNSTGVNGIGITVNCKNPERLLAFYDWLLQREVQDYLQWGEEGIDWIAKENNSKELTPERRAIMYDVAKKRDLTGTTLWNYSPKWQGMYLSDGAPSGAAESADEYAAALSEYEKDFLAQYDTLYPAGLMNPPVERLDYYPVWSMTIEDGSPAAVASVKVSDTGTKYYPRMALAETDEEFEAIWAEFVAEFNAIDLAAYKNEVDRQIALKMAP